MTKQEYDRVVEFVAKRIYMFDELFFRSYGGMYNEKILRMFRDHEFEKEWDEFKKEVEKYPEHCGDCTGVASPCLRCQYEEYLEEAREELKKAGVAM